MPPPDPNQYASIEISLVSVCLLAAKGSSNFTLKMLKSICTKLFSMAEIQKNLSTFDSRIQTEEIAFDAAEMIVCSDCGRNNPPNRLKCIYCAAVMDIDLERTTAVKPNLRKLELWESGHNLILKSQTATVNAARAANYLTIEPAVLAAILDFGTPLPLARVESEKEAAILQSGLASFGLDCTIVADRDLAPEKPPARLGSIRFLYGCLTVKDFNTGNVTQINADDLALIMPGLISQSRVDSIEKKGRRGKSKPIDETSTISDESILDIYSRGDSTGFRVPTTGFDFSCLDEDKGLLASENFRRLIVRLKEHAPNARVVNDYKAVRAALGYVWEVETRNDPKGMQNSGLGKRAFGHVATTSNLNQFTKYSRLQWRLL